MEAVAMGKQRIKPNYRRRVLRCRIWIIANWRCSAGLGSPASRRCLPVRIDQFIACTAPNPDWPSIDRSRALPHVPGIRSLAGEHHQPATGRVRRLAHEAADSGLLSPN